MKQVWKYRIIINQNEWLFYEEIFLNRQKYEALFNYLWVKLPAVIKAQVVNKYLLKTVGQLLVNLGIFLFHEYPCEN